ncbi:type I-U CRISPR-associated protein Csb2 [Nonomuraea sp. NPDC055795]
MALHVRLRHGRYDAGALSPSAPEWPPHPARVFCALVASADSDEDWQALRWLERSDPPQVWADATATPTRTDGYVVTNQTSPSGGSQTWPGRTNGPRTRVASTPQGDSFAIVWPQVDAEPRFLTRLERMARRVPYIGRSTSQAELTAASEIPQTRPAWTQWAPTRMSPSAVNLRTPYPGYVDALRETYEQGGRAWEVARGVPYAPVVEEVSPAESASSPWDDVMIWAFDKPTARIGGDQLLRLTTTLRKAVLHHVGTEVPPQVSGHGADDRPHVAFLALPDVGHPQADGHLMGVALAVPRDMPAAQWQYLVRSVIGSDPLTWLAPWQGRQVSLRYGADPRRRTLKARTWQGPAEGVRSWVTATPMVTDGMMRARRSVEELVAKSLARVGCPEPADLEVSTAPLTNGAVWRPRQGTMPEGRPNRPMVHVRVTFKQPYVGPLIAGSMRYLGLGLFVPLGGES